MPNVVGISCAIIQQLTFYMLSCTVCLVNTPVRLAHWWHPIDYGLTSPTPKEAPKTSLPRLKPGLTSISWVIFHSKSQSNLYSRQSQKGRWHYLVRNTLKRFAQSPLVEINRFLTNCVVAHMLVRLEI